MYSNIREKNHKAHTPEASKRTTVLVTNEKQDHSQVRKLLNSDPRGGDGEEISGNSLWRQAWRKFRPKRRKWEAGGKAGHRLEAISSPEVSRSQPINESLSMKAKIIAVTMALPQEKKTRGRLKQSEGEGGNGGEGKAKGYRAGGVVAMASSASAQNCLGPDNSSSHTQLLQKCGVEPLSIGPFTGSCSAGDLAEEACSFQLPSASSFGH